MREPSNNPILRPEPVPLRAGDASGVLPQLALSPAESRALFELGRAVSSGQDLTRISRAAMDAVAVLVPAADAFLYIVEDEPATLVPRGSLRAASPEAGTEHDLEQRCLAAASRALHQSLTAVSQSEPQPQRINLDVAPMALGGQVLGCLVAARRPERAFTGPERQKLRWVADQLTMALQVAELAVRRQHAAREIQLLTEVGADSASLGLDRFMTVVTERIGRALHLDLAALYFLDSHRGELVWSCGWHPEGRPAPSVPRLPSAALDAVLRARQAKCFHREEIEPETWRDDFSRFGLAELAVVPILAKDSAIGILIAGRQALRIAQDDLRLLTALSVQVAVVADNTRLLAEAQQRAADLALVQRIGLAMSSTLQERSVLKSAVAAVRESLECDTVRVHRRQGTRFESLVYKGPRLTTADEWAIIDENSPSLARVLAAGRAVEMTASDLEPPRAEMLERTGIRSFAAVPLLLPAVTVAPRGPTIGLVTVGRRSSRRFGSAELAMLDAVAGQLTIALRNAALYEETHQRAEDLTIIHEAGRALLDGTSLDATLDRAAERLARLLSVQAVLLLLVDADGRNLVGRGLRTGQGVVEEVRIPLDSDALSARAVRDRKPMESREIEHHPSIQRLALGWRPVWVTVLPFGTAEQVLGVILLVGGDPARHLSQAEIDRVMAVGNQLAIAIDHSRLTASLTRSVKALEETQKQLVRRERLAALGGLAAVVAHEVRNPLGVISNSLGFLAKQDLSGDASRAFQLIREESERIEQIVAEMMEYSRPSEPRLVPTPLRPFVEDAVASASAAERSRGTRMDLVETRVEVEEGLPAVPMDDRQIHQVLVNLLSNAYQSLGGKGLVRVQVQRCPDRAGLLLRVSDDGAGMNDETRARIFEPFFTTKAKGSGLGLAIVKRIVDGHGWDIEADSTPGKGARFTITVPIVQG